MFSMFTVDKTLTPTSIESAISMVNDEIKTSSSWLYEHGCRFLLYTYKYGVYEIKFFGNVVMSDYSKYHKNVPRNEIKLIDDLSKIVNKHIDEFKKLTVTNKK